MTFTAVGSQAPVEVDVRVIVATNKDLEEQVKKGLFRDDLFYRIHVIPIYLPPLRERKRISFHWLITSSKNVSCR